MPSPLWLDWSQPRSSCSRCSVSAPFLDRRPRAHWLRLRRTVHRDRERLNAKATPDTRGSVFALYMVATYATYGGGQFVLNLADPEGFELFALGAALFCLALVPVSITHAAAPSLPPSPRLRLSELRHVAPVAIAGCAATGLASSVFYALVPVFLHKAGYPAADIAMFIATAIAGGFAFQIPIGWLSDRVDRPMLACALAFLPGADGGAHDHTRAGCRLARLSQRLPARRLLLDDLPRLRRPRQRSRRARARGRGRGQLILISGIASCLGPMAGWWLMDVAGIKAVFWFMAAVALAFVVTGAWRIGVTGGSRTPAAHVHLPERADVAPGRACR